MEKPLITNIQKYSIHDGEGTRTTVFFKGCPLSCRWCHNPETQSRGNVLFFYEERCSGCSACVEKCPRHAIERKDGKAWTDRSRCVRCGACIEECVNNAREMGARTYEIPELIQELMKDRIFYETSHGGVTLSGGEVLSADLDYVEELMKRLASRGIRINVDTCGAVPYDAFARVLPYTDTFLYDIKMMDREKHRLYTGQYNDEILDNLIRLSGEGAGIWIRIPVIGGVNDSEEEIRRIGTFLKEKEIHAGQVNLLPYHDTGSGKYARIGRTYAGEKFYTPSNEEMEKLRALMESFTACPVYTGG